MSARPHALSNNKMIAVVEASRIASRFSIEEPIEVSDFLGKGNINLDTFLVAAGPNRRNYLLQRVNSDVFPLPDRVMAGMVVSLDAQRQSLSSGHTHAGAGWQAMELVPTLDGRLYHDGETDATWRLISFIEDTVSYKSLNDVPEDRRLFVAREVGKGLAVYSDLTSTIDPATVPISLPGYRDTGLYYRQFHAALAGHRSLGEVSDLLPNCPEARAASERHFLCALDENASHGRRSDSEIKRFIELALDCEPLAMSLQKARAAGEIRTTVIHGDTKIENFLFDQATGNVVSLVDLDTIMPLTWLADWGDMVRSLCNPAGEKEEDLSKVVVSSEAYAAVLDGFLSTASSPTPFEVELMPRAVQAIALELGVRFLADYLRGDTYFSLGPNDPHDLNKRRAMVQLTLFERLLSHEPEARQLLKSRQF
ncbi:MAG: aminoglycoside phosphotransferase family protein [Armatimonadota bacterium]|nr:aminoglycoside phosphotransferase family protein [Armatimonadota bacterium]